MKSLQEYRISRLRKRQTPTLRGGGTMPENNSEGIAICGLIFLFGINATGFRGFRIRGPIPSRNAPLCINRNPLTDNETVLPDDPGSRCEAILAELQDPMPGRRQRLTGGLPAHFPCILPAGRSRRFRPPRRTEHPAQSSLQDIHPPREPRSQCQPGSDTSASRQSSSATGQSSASHPQRSCRSTDSARASAD